MSRPRSFAILLGAATAVVAVGVVRRGRRGMGGRVPGGILIGDAAFYDALSHRLLLGSLFDRVAADVAAVAPRVRGYSRWGVVPAAYRSGYLAGTGST
jgi:hypothetical protein